MRQQYDNNFDNFFIEDDDDDDFYDDETDDSNDQVATFLIFLAAIALQYSPQSSFNAQHRI